MSRYHGKQHRGAARDLRHLKREEAEARNALTPHDRRRAHRLGKCSCGETESSVSTES